MISFCYNSLEMAIIGGVIYTLASDTIGMHRLQVCSINQASILCFSCSLHITSGGTSDIIFPRRIIDSSFHCRRARVLCRWVHDRPFRTHEIAASLRRGLAPPDYRKHHLAPLLHIRRRLARLPRDKQNRRWDWRPDTPFPEQEAKPLCARWCRCPCASINPRQRLQHWNRWNGWWLCGFDERTRQLWWRRDRVWL